MSVDNHRWIDSHSHVFDENCIYSEGARYRPKKFAPAKDYLALLDRHHIAGAVLVQPSFLGTDNSCLCNAIALRADRLRGVAVVSADVDAATLSGLHAQGIRGVRLNLVGVADPDFTQVAWRRWLGQVRDASLSLEIHAEGNRWCGLLPPLLDQGVTVVIDHLGRPDTPDPMDCAGFRAILAAGSSGHAWVKVSGPYRMPGGVAEKAVPMLLDAFGAKHLLWGSDYPWTQHEEGKSMSALMVWLEGLSLTLEQRQAISGDNTRVLYDLPA